MAERDPAADDPVAAAHVRVADDPAVVDPVGGVRAADDPVGGVLVGVAADPHRNPRTMAKSRVSRFRA